MLDHIIIGQYVPGHSKVHRLDPRAKLICLMLFMVFLFVSRHPLSIGVALLIAVLAFGLANVPLTFYLRGMRFIAIIIIFTFLLHLFMTKEGPVLFTTPIVTIYLGGVLEGVLVGVRLLLLVIMASLLTLTTTPVDLTDGMESLMLPLKKVGMPTHELAFMISIALRFIPTLLEEAMKIIKAQMARGANFTQGSIWKRVKAFVPVLVPLFVQSLNRAEDLAIAMESRGYEGGEGRTKFRILYWKRMDTIALVILTLYSMTAIFTRFLM
ncbi:energy-coupling factor transporter transmembrane component T family protein [Evansella tamaricis]|uniref:Energy-coupling factor transporter transmembrane protein EcfT n=1 Tax=Evansella tamaricis TaxID=2069301 RepID=A0ABS6JBH5_9BACI|nr:energy-coupling factor transporter transmembrane protein EcfT [Evansella tamaricis]MBU9710775.1 energy-coupling factor transporter transmembrane protein EcfT [Evansella tamaricis]